ncbi:B3 domain-containing protein [Nymphaea thermarum]|nr:B3 domain-containing protein [Nymphaea thermarum]
MGRCKDCREELGNSSQSNGRDSQPGFFKLLIGDFTKKLWIPPSFADYLITGRAILRGPGGDVWNVLLKRKGCRFFFGKGWKRFARHHRLNTTDFLMFTYDDALEFNVLIFDSSGCEREDAFFVRNRANADENEEQNKRQNAGESISSEAYLDISMGRGETNGHQKQGKVSGYSSEVIPKPDEAALQGRGNYINPLCEQSERSDCRKHPDYRSQRWKENDKAAKVGSRYASSAEVGRQNQAGTSSLSIIRPPATMEEKSRTLIMASSFYSRNPFFISPMRRSSVSDPFKLHIPAKFSRAHLVMKNTKGILRNAITGEWPVACYYDEKRGHMLSAGWPGFVRAHSLVEGDACVFELLEEEGLVLNVIIYKMADETMLV